MVNVKVGLPFGVYKQKTPFRFGAYLAPYAMYRGVAHLSNPESPQRPNLPFHTSYSERIAWSQNWGGGFEIAGGMNLVKLGYAFDVTPTETVFSNIDGYARIPTSDHSSMRQEPGSALRRSVFGHSVFLGLLGVNRPVASLLFRFEHGEAGGISISSEPSENRFFLNGYFIGASFNLSMPIESVLMHLINGGGIFWGYI